MRKVVIVLLILCFTVLPVTAMEFTAPEAPEAAEELLPAEQETLGRDSGR